MEDLKYIEKRVRGTSWPEAHKNLLMDLVREQNTNPKKLAAWADMLKRQGTTNQVINAIQEPLQEIQNTQKVVSTGSGSSLSSSSKKPKKKENVDKASTAEQIASVETACRKELHEVQMANEERRARNLDLEEKLLKVKIDFFMKRMQSLENDNK